MDSAINVVLWEKSSLPILADAWIDNKQTDDLNLLEEFESKLYWQLIKEKAEQIEKLEWKPDPTKL